MTFFDRIPPVAPTFEAAPDGVEILSRWREISAPNWRDTSFLAALRASVKVVRPLARDLAAVLRDGDTASTIGAALQRDHEVRAAANTLATDLLASAMLVEALAGNAAAQTALDHLRRRRGLPRVAWRKIAKRERSRLPDNLDLPSPAA
jgi:hypothetical protein